ncbi:MAG: class I SAM-dependent methyltransferase [Lachnospiraceae bacterium]|nr:class I SAM-dependent methyltransferase [Lachnospiraceae bacterium]
MKTDLELKNKKYWDRRAPGYSEVNKEELNGVQRENWKSFLVNEIDSHFGKDHSQINIIDIGAGPGFISRLLAEAGYNVSAFDFSEEMLNEARQNSGEYASSIDFIQGNAMETGDFKEKYDVVFSRNLTWNLPDPKKAYETWNDVLNDNGLMLVFDANWYSYLVDDEKRVEFEADRKNVKDSQLEDYNVGDGFDEMEQIAKTRPMTNAIRPGWDVEFLSSIKSGHAEAVENIGEILYSEKEKINYKSTPMFMVKYIKSGK